MEERPDRGAAEAWKTRLLAPGAYRPISLLNTIGKLLEAVMARRLSFFAEKYGLLPDTQFGEVRDARLSKLYWCWRT